MDRTVAIPNNAAPVADIMVLECETRAHLVFTVTCEISWRGRRTFIVSVTDNRNAFTSAAETTSYRLAKRTFKKLQRTWL